MGWTDTQLADIFFAEEEENYPLEGRYFYFNSKYGKLVYFDEGNCWCDPVFLFPKETSEKEMWIVCEKWANKNITEYDIQKLSRILKLSVSTTRIFVEKFLELKELLRKSNTNGAIYSIDQKLPSGV